MIEARVVPGRGSVSRRVTGERLEKRRRACKMRLVPGTLNLDGRPAALLGELGEPTVTCEPRHRLGPLRFWPVLLEAGDLTGPVIAYYVRHVRSRMGHLEFCADVHLRSLGLSDGDLVTVRGL